MDAAERRQALPVVARGFGGAAPIQKEEFFYG